MRAQYRVRRAAAGDLTRIVAIEKASFGAEAYDCKLFAYYLRSCGPLFLVAEDNTGVGAYMITCLAGKASRAELISVAVDPGQRRRGAASALLESTLRRLRLRGVRRLNLVVRDTNQAALAFYKKYGFRPLRRLRRYYEDGGDGIIMTRAITPC